MDVCASPVRDARKRSTTEMVTTDQVADSGGWRVTRPTPAAHYVNYEPLTEETTQKNAEIYDQKNEFHIFRSFHDTKTIIKKKN
jgi:hypothetical protein